MYPLESVLDDSIGCAIWFAARGRGHLLTSNSVQSDPLVTSGDDGEVLDQKIAGEIPASTFYTSPAKVY